MADQIINLGGYGSGSWSSDLFGETVTNFTGTTGLGSVTTTANATASVTGLAGTSALGDVGFAIFVNTTVTGLAGTTGLGTTTEVIAGGGASPTGVSATGSVGSVATSGVSTTTVSGVGGTTGLGYVEYVETWTGWSSGPWGRRTWGRPVVLEVVTGVSATGA